MSEYMRSRRGEEGGEGFFCRFTFGQFFAILVLEVFTLFFVFYLGARYGREFLGLDRKAEVAAASEEAAQPEPAVMSTSDPEAAKMARELVEKAQTPELKDRISKMFDAAQGQGKTPDVVEHNRAADVAEAGPQNPLVISGGEEKPAPPEATMPPAPIEGAQGRAVPPPARDELAAAGKTPPPEGSVKGEEGTIGSQATDASVFRIKSVENARYSVQVGSYPQLAEATRIVERWKGKGYPAYLMIADIPDRGRWYRVRIGGFQTREDASRYLREFQSRENIEALIVMNEQ